MTKDSLFDNELIRSQRKKLADYQASTLDMLSKTMLVNQKYWLSILSCPQDAAMPFWNHLGSFVRLNMEEGMNRLETTTESLEAGQHYVVGLLKYISDFMNPYWTALESFLKLEKEKLARHTPMESALDYLELLQFNVQIANQCLNGTARDLVEFHTAEGRKAYDAVMKAIAGRDTGVLKEYAEKLDHLLETVVYDYPEAIRAIEPEFGFHFDDGGYKKIVETDRFIVYQVFSRDKTIKPRKGGKPVLIMHPYVLGPNILAFLPGEKKSYVHAFADQGIPTYIRILKDIQTTPAVQVMTGEDDARDTRIICEKLMAIHGRKVTLNGFCQGGFIALLDILSGELDGLVDALITCVAPMDGTKSKSLVEYMEHLPPRFRDLNYALKELPSGHSVVDGKVMSWVYKLKSMDKEAPVATLYKDLMNFNTHDGRKVRINKTAAALHNWLIYDRSDLPEAITRLSFDSYTIPVTKDGTLPVKLFGKTLNYRGIPERGIKWLLCYAEGDDLVDSAAALSPVEFIDVEVTPFPKGHGAIATSWSDPGTACAVHKVFGTGCRGPVRFQMDLDAETAKE
jgi:hypothetical protein